MRASILPVRGKIERRVCSEGRCGREIETCAVKIGRGRVWGVPVRVERPSVRVKTLPVRGKVAPCGVRAGGGLKFLWARREMSL